MEEQVSLLWQKFIFLPVEKTAILLATNARTSHMPLYKGAKKIKEHYSLKISLP